ncbi:helix-turn-helix domain-containing protein [Moraxella oblonga]|uniref:helix-turn-helix domain-containing protein n=1 Tax=Moraxella oblonga TaxID=200413 RepID=UPI0008379F57|nr:helix-turn-helix domain-containing protein [Moraxella oblonga]
MTTQDNIRQYREKLDMTQEQMAEKLHLTKNGYAKIERGETALTVARLEQIAGIFDIDMSELLKEKSELNLLLGDNNHSNFHNHYYNQTQEIEKLQMTIDYQKELLTHKDELLAQKDKEIDLLRKLLNQ